MAFISYNGKDLCSRDACLLNSLLLWYNQEESRVRIFLSIVQRKSGGVSLRVIDWLITNYSKTTNVTVLQDGKDASGRVPTSLYRDYQKRLSAYNKKNFDPFARRKRIRVTFMSSILFETTVGQLNFFRWFISKELDRYVISNHAVIEKHMKSVIQIKQSPKQIVKEIMSEIVDRVSNGVEGKDLDAEIKISDCKSKVMGNGSKVSEPGIKVRVNMEVSHCYSGNFTLTF